MAQKKVTLQSGNNASFYSTIDSAILNAVNGDIIYIPGGSYVIPSLVINKGVQIFGAGHYPDSTSATGQTVLTGEVRIVSGADNGSLQGCYILGSVFFGTTGADQNVNNFGISRCNMANLYISYDGNATSTSTNLYISENVILGGIWGGNCINTLYKKNIVNTVQHGDDISIITYGSGVHWALEYAASHPELSIEILDLRTLLPLDYDAIASTVQKTGKALILHEDVLIGGIGGEIAAWITEHCFSYLDGPVMRCASLDTPVPFDIGLEKNFMAKARLHGTIQKLVNY